MGKGPCRREACESCGAFPARETVCVDTLQECYSTCTLPACTAFAFAQLCTNGGGCEADMEGESAQPRACTGKQRPCLLYPPAAAVGGTREDGNQLYQCYRATKAETVGAAAVAVEAGALLSAAPFINQWQDNEFQFTCPENSVISGVFATAHDSVWYQGRRWKATCSKVTGATVEKPRPFRDLDFLDAAGAPGSAVPVCQGTSGLAAATGFYAVRDNFGGVRWKVQCSVLPGVAATASTGGVFGNMAADAISVQCASPGANMVVRMAYGDLGTDPRSQWDIGCADLARAQEQCGTDPAPSEAPVSTSSVRATTETPADLPAASCEPGDYLAAGGCLAQPSCQPNQYLKDWTATAAGVCTLCSSLGCGTQTRVECTRARDARCIAGSTTASASADTSTAVATGTTDTTGTPDQTTGKTKATPPALATQATPDGVGAAGARTATGAATTAPATSRSTQQALGRSATPPQQQNQSGAVPCRCLGVAKQILFGVLNHQGNGKDCASTGSKGRWCYVAEDAGCGDVENSTHWYNSFFSYNVCNGSFVANTTEAPQTTQSPPAPTPCECSGQSRVTDVNAPNGLGLVMGAQKTIVTAGADCNAMDQKPRWCYVLRTAACNDVVESRYPFHYYSYDVCRPTTTASTSTLASTQEAKSALLFAQVVGGIMAALVLACCIGGVYYSYLNQSRRRALRERGIPVAYVQSNPTFSAGAGGNERSRADTVTWALPFEGAGGKAVARSASTLHVVTPVGGGASNLRFGGGLGGPDQLLDLCHPEACTAGIHTQVALLTMALCGALALAVELPFEEEDLLNITEYCFYLPFNCTSNIFAADADAAQTDLNKDIQERIVILLVAINVCAAVMLVLAGRDKKVAWTTGWHLPTPVSFLTPRSNTLSLLIALSLGTLAQFYFQLFYWFVLGSRDRYSPHVSLPMPSGELGFLRNVVFFLWCAVIGVVAVPFSSLYNTNHRGTGLYAGGIFSMAMLLLFLSTVIVVLDAGYDAALVLTWVPSLACCVLIIVTIVRQMLGWSNNRNDSYRVYVKNLFATKDVFAARLEAESRKRSGSTSRKDQGDKDTAGCGCNPFRMLWNWEPIEVLTGRDPMFPCPPKLLLVMLMTSCGLFIFITHWYDQVHLFQAQEIARAEAWGGCSVNSSCFHRQYNPRGEFCATPVSDQLQKLTDEYNDFTGMLDRVSSNRTETVGLVDRLLNRTEQLANTVVNETLNAADRLAAVNMTVAGVMDQARQLKDYIASTAQNLTAPGLDDLQIPVLLPDVASFRIFNVPILFDFLYGMSCDDVKRLINDLTIVGQVAPIPGTLYVLWAMMRMVTSVKRDLLARFRGLHRAETEAFEKLNPPGFQLTNYVKFGGYQIIFPLLAWWTLAVLFACVIGVFVCAFEFQLVRSYIFDWLSENAANWTATIAAALMLSLFQRFYAYYCQAQGETRGTSSWFNLRHRRLFSILDFSGFLFNSCLGLFVYVTRLIMCILLIVLRIGRLDSTSFVVFVEWFDWGHTAYRGYIGVEAFYSNPVLRVFVEIAASRKRMSRLAGDGSVLRWGAPSSRAKNKWFLAYTLIHNPRLRVYRIVGDREASALADAAEAEAAAAAAAAQAFGGGCCGTTTSNARVTDVESELIAEIEHRSKEIRQLCQKLRRIKMSHGSHESAARTSKARRARAALQTVVGLQHTAHEILPIFYPTENQLVDYYAAPSSASRRMAEHMIYSAPTPSDLVDYYAVAAPHGGAQVEYGEAAADDVYGDGDAYADAQDPSAGNYETVATLASADADALRARRATRYDQPLPKGQGGQGNRQGSNFARSQQQGSICSMRGFDTGTSVS